MQGKYKALPINFGSVKQVSKVKRVPSGCNLHMIIVFFELFYIVPGLASVTCLDFS